MTKRSRIIAFGSAALLVVAGVVAVVVSSGTVGQVLALVLISLGFVLATGLVFLEVGLSEDRERERAGEARRAAAARPSHPERASRSATGRVKPRLQRMRGARRRLK